MKIIKQIKNNNSVQFKMLSPGEVFHVNDDITFIKISNGMRFNAVSLESGAAFEYSENASVYPLEAECKIYGVKEL